MIDLYEVVTKLAGPIQPVGETNADTRRLENLEQLISLTNSLLNEIVLVAEAAADLRASVSILGKRAEEALDSFEGNHLADRYTRAAKAEIQELRDALRGLLAVSLVLDDGSISLPRDVSGRAMVEKARSVLNIEETP